jgi:hypothetical protein
MEKLCEYYSQQIHSTKYTEIKIDFELFNKFSEGEGDLVPIKQRIKLILIFSDH